MFMNENDRNIIGKEREREKEREKKRKRERMREKIFAQTRDKL